MTHRTNIGRNALINRLSTVGVPLRLRGLLLLALVLVLITSGGAG
ncbi:hypothetical protein FHW69_002621 [Luteibacter sp. Sphag1AF]|nr:hypothetical protein [Luteibacter sp. Sphag1AF]MBB3227989.1 hypothetical protein [Luteibacter sp. Sphag1AF]